MSPCPRWDMKDPWLQSPPFIGEYTGEEKAAFSESRAKRLQPWTGGWNQPSVCLILSAVQPQSFRCRRDQRGGLRSATPAWPALAATLPKADGHLVVCTKLLVREQASSSISLLKHTIPQPRIFLRSGVGLGRTTFHSGFSEVCSSTGKESTCQCRRPGWIPGSGRSAGEGNGYPLWYLGLPWWLRR